MNKLFKPLAFVLCAFVLFSCSDDDETDNLIGKWYPTTYSVDGETYSYDVDSCGDDYLEFYNDETGLFVDYDECELYEDAFTWSRNGDQLTIVFYGVSSTVTIRQLTSTDLSITYMEDWDDDGIEETTIIENFEK